MKTLKALLLLALVWAGVAHAETWERRSGSYSEGAPNSTKWATVSANREGIPSAKLDGEFNHVYHALNDIEDRTPPSVSGNSGLFLTNDGSEALWSGISTSEVISATAGLYAGGDISATGHTITAAALSGTTLYINTSARLGTVSTTGQASVTSLYSVGDISLGGLLSVPNVSTTGVSGTVSATNVYAKTVSASVMAIGSTSFAALNIPKAWGTFTAGGSLTAGVGVLSVSRASQGLFDVSLTTSFVSNTAYAVQANLMDSPAGAGAFTSRACVMESGTNQVNGFRLKCQSGTSTALDPSLVYFTVLGL